MFPFCVLRPASWKNQGLPFLSPLSGESWGHSLLRSQAPGYLPWVPVQTADVCDPLSVWLVPGSERRGKELSIS